MTEVPQGEHATFSFLDLITLALVLDAIPDFTHGKVLGGFVCLWLAYANHAIGVRWPVSRYLIPPAALTLLVYAFVWCIDIKDAEMKYLAAGLIGAVILIAAVLAYSWIGKKESPPEASEKIATPLLSVIPHLQAKLVIDAVRKDDLDLHIEVENIGSLEVQDLRGNMRTAEMTDIDVGMLLAPILPPGGHLSIPGLPVYGLNKYGNLSVDLIYDSNVDGATHKFSSHYGFMVRPVDMKPQSILPTTWQENAGVVLGQEQNTMEAALRTLVGPMGTMMFAVPLRRPDGTPNFVVMTNDKRQFIFDAGSRILSFTTTSTMGERNTVRFDFPDQSSDTAVIGCAWNDDKSEAKLIMNGKFVP
jgi:hypothetical protein